MKKIHFLLIFALIFTVTLTLSTNVNHASAAVQTTLYVSPTGDDSNPGTQSQPFLTLQKAQAEVRTLNTNMTGDIEVILMGGTYQLASTLTFTSEDSGTNGYNVIYKADTGSTPIISGGTPITGWTLHDTGLNIYKAYVGTTLDTRQVYVNGLRATRAKSANNPGFTKTSTGYTAPSTGTYSTIASWGNVRNIEIVAQNSWQRHRIGIDSISGTNITMKNPGFTNVQSRLTNATWIENAYELLDAAGEWYLNRSDGYMYYKPRTGEDMSTAIAIAATLETLIQGDGTLDNPVHNMKLDGLTFSYNTWLMPNGNYGYPDNQGGVILLDPVNGNYHKLVTPAGVSFSAAKNVTVQNCTFTHMGNAGLSFNYGSQDNTIDHNSFTELSGNGINIGGVDPDIDHHPTDSRLIVKNNVVSNNTITNIGVEYGDNIGIFVGFTEGSVIRHNTLYDLPYTAISVGFGWGAVDEYGPTIAKNNIISHNLIHDYMKSMNDGGGIYTLGEQRGSQVSNNYLYAQKNQYAYIYHDNGTDGYYTTNNVFSNTGTATSKWYFASRQFSGASEYLNAHDNIARYNYYSAGMSIMQADGSNVASDNYSVANNAWDATAQAIIDNAGVDGGDGPAPISRYQSMYTLDGFENGFGNWVNANGTPSTSTTTVHAGSNSYALNQDQDAIYQSFSTSQNKIVSMWFYDDASVTNMLVAGFVNDGVSNRAIEVYTGNSATKYSYRIDGTHYTSNVNRTTGWHKFTWDYTSGTKVDMYIDSNLIASPTGLTSFNKITIGDLWAEGVTATAAKFDDVEITDTLNLPPVPPTFSDGFETGLANWTTANGTASISTAQAHSGSSSYITNEDQDAIQRIFSTSYNKVATVWFYDNASSTTMQAGAFVDDSTNIRGILVSATASTTKYSYRVGATVTASNITRTTGWHEFKWDYTSGTKVDMYIDGVLVASPTGLTNFNKIKLGDLWAGNGNTYNVYFDDIIIQ